MKVILELIFYFLSFFIPKSKAIAFGAWNGKAYKDNPRYLMEYLLTEESCYDLFWVGEASIEDQLPVGIYFLDINDSKTKWKLMKMKFAFVSHSFADICDYNVFSRTTVVQMWHGIGIKKLINLQTTRRLDLVMRKILRSYDYFLASSEKDKNRKLELFKSYGANSNNIIMSGQSRNISMMNTINEKTENIILYLPTFRNDKRFSFTEVSTVQYNQLEKVLLKYNFLIAEKRHPKEIELYERNKNYSKILYLKDETSVEELLLKSKVLITDYSSVVYDYLLLDRPIINYIYDLESYLKNESGLYYNIEDVAPGFIANTFDELLSYIEVAIKDPKAGFNKRNEVKKEMLTFEDGLSSKRIAEYFELLEVRDE